MTMMRMRLLSNKLLSASACLSLCLSALPKSIGEELEPHYRSGTVPRAMREYMRKINCAPVRDFYSAYHIDYPPFVSLGDGDFIFVCEALTESAEVNYMSVVKVDNKEHPFYSCSGIINNYFVLPGGMLVERKKIPREEWDSFHKFENTPPSEWGKEAIAPTLKDSVPSQWEPEDGKFLVWVEIGVGFQQSICVHGSWYTQAVA